MSVWFSSGAFKSRDISNVLSEAESLGIQGIELSSGMSYQQDILAPVRAQNKADKQRFLVHNYFPPPEIPFVLNVGALDEENLVKTREMGRFSLQLAKELGAPFYSIHAGFAARLKPEQLGKPKEQARSITADDIDREAAYEVMIQTVREMADFAATLQLDVLIENNVISPLYLEKMPLNPLLLTEGKEAAQFFVDIDRDNVGLLLDVAHTKVSATALGFKPDAFVEQVAEHVRCLHLSDNDGREDSNQPFDETAWFIPWLKDFSDREMVIEAYRLEPEVMLSQRDLLERIIA